MPMNEVSNYEGIPAMTSPKVHEYLTALGEGWRDGVAIELGCWLGGSSAPLLKGLVKAGYNKPFYAFEKWVVNKEQIAKAASQGVRLSFRQDSEPIYRENVKKYYPHVKTFKGVLPLTLNRFPGVPIDICIFDAPKAEPVFTGCLRHLEKHFKEGETVLGLLDFKFYDRHSGEKRRKFRAPVDFMEKYGKHFTLVQQWDDEAVVFFRYESKIKWKT